MEQKLVKILNIILKKNNRDELKKLKPDLSLRNDLGFDSLDLAELTVRIEDEFLVDIFENRIIDTIEEIVKQIPRGE